MIRRERNNRTLTHSSNDSYDTRDRQEAQPQYTVIYDNIMRDKALRSTSKLVYSRLCYRMQLSITKGKRFYNKAGCFYYVIYSINDLATDTGSGRTAVINALKQLVDLNLVIKHPYKLEHVMELELPKFEYQTSGELKPERPNRIKNYKTKRTNNTDNTEKRRVNQKTKNKVLAWIKSIRLKVTKTNLVRHYHMPEKLVDNISATASDEYGAFKAMIGLVFKAKKCAYHHLSKKYNPRTVSHCLSFEHNGCYSSMARKFDMDTLVGQYRRAYISAKKLAHRVEMKKPRQYDNVFCRTIMKCLSRYFTEAGKLEIINRPSKQDKLNIPIPIFKI